MSEAEVSLSSRDSFVLRTQKLATSSVRVLGDGINNIKANPKIQEGASTVASSVRELSQRLNDIKANPKVQDGATAVKSSVRKLGDRLQELKASEGVKKASDGVKNLSGKLQKINLVKLIGDMEKDQNLADNLERINKDLINEQAMCDMVREAEAACMQAIADHFDEFVAEHPNATYEEWIADLHPENIHEGKLLDGLGSELDHRFYVEDSDHRILWNSHLGGARIFVSARTMGWTHSDDDMWGQIDFLSVPNPEISEQKLLPDDMWCFGQGDLLSVPNTDVAEKKPGYDDMLSSFVGTDLLSVPPNKIVETDQKSAPTGGISEDLLCFDNLENISA